MKIVIAGGTGLLGSLIVNSYLRTGHEIVIFTRQHRPDFKNVHYCKWDGKAPGYWCHELEDADVLINLNGKSVDCRYTEENKQMIYDTRLDATYALGKAVQHCKNPPKLWINAASATIYPHSIDQPMTEKNAQFENDFSVDVCKKWEKLFDSFDLPETRKVILRIGIVLSKKGSALFPLKMLARVGLGGKIGKGNQMVNWLHEVDFVNGVRFIIDNTFTEGVYNLTSPQPVSNKTLMKTIRRKMGMAFGFPLSEWLLKMGAVVIGTEPELVLKSRYVLPERLQHQGFNFQFPAMEKALADLMD